MFEPNLLGPERLNALKREQQTRTVVRASLVIAMISLVTLIGLVQINMLLNEKSARLAAEIGATRVVSSSGKDLPVAETTKRVNQRLTVLKPVLNQPEMSSYLVSISQALPAGITLSSLTLSATSNSLTGRGVAPTRNDIPILQQSLEGLAILDKITVKSNINERTNIQFELNATLATQPPAGTTP